MNRSPAVLECRGLRKRFGELEAARGVDFRIGEGDTYGLLGPNGAGKTTTISMVCGLLEPDAGEVLVAGERRPRAACARRRPSATYRRSWRSTPI
jgi:ABC-2 type transport system ATP-binding protein